MAITITDLGSSINVNLGPGQDNFDFPKNSTLIWLENSDGFVYFMYNTRCVAVDPSLLAVPTTGALLKATIDGFISHSDNLRLLGRNSDIDNAIEDLWESGGEYVQPTAGGVQMQIVSSQAGDGVAGAGIQELVIEYLDANFEEKTETIITNGTTPVNTVATDILRINDLYGTVFGSSKKAVGLITLRHVSSSPSYGFISGGQTNTRQSIYCVPLGKTLYITKISGGAGSGTALSFTEILLKATTDKNDNYIDSAYELKACLISSGTGVEKIFSDPIVCPEKTDIKLSAMSNLATSSAVVCGMIEGYLE